MRVNWLPYVILLLRFSAIIWPARCAEARLHVHQGLPVALAALIHTFLPRKQVLWHRSERFLSGLLLHRSNRKAVFWNNSCTAVELTGFDGDSYQKESLNGYLSFPVRERSRAHAIGVHSCAEDGVVLQHEYRKRARYFHEVWHCQPDSRITRLLCTFNSKAIDSGRLGQVVLSENFSRFGGYACTTDTTRNTAKATLFHAFPSSNRRQQFKQQRLARAWLYREQEHNFSSEYREYLRVYDLRREKLVSFSSDFMSDTGYLLTRSRDRLRVWSFDPRRSRRRLRPRGDRLAFREIGSMNLEHSTRRVDGRCFASGSGFFVLVSYTEGTRLYKLAISDGDTLDTNVIGLPKDHMSREYGISSIELSQSFDVGVGVMVRKLKDGTFDFWLLEDGSVSPLFKRLLRVVPARSVHAARNFFAQFYLSHDFNQHGGYLYDGDRLELWDIDLVDRRKRMRALLDGFHEMMKH